MSLPQMPQAATRISTSPAPGAGIGRSASARCLYSESSRAFMPGGNPSRRSGYSRKPPAMAEGFVGRFARILRAEGRAAAAGALHARIVELEASCFQGLYVIHHAAVQVHQGGGVDEHLQIVEFEDFIHHAGLVFEGHRVLKTGAPPAYHADA